MGMRDYAYLSSLFSEVEGTTIEKYIILQKIERVKELLVYDELTHATCVEPQTGPPNAFNLISDNFLDVVQPNQAVRAEFTIRLGPSI